MLPSLGFQEILLLAVLALVVVGPKNLPLLFRKLGRWTAKLRGMAQEFRTGFDELARQAELDELKREVDALRRSTDLQGIGRELTQPLRTLEDYAGLPPPAAPAPLPAPTLETPEGEAPVEGPHDLADAPASPSMGEVARSAGGGARATLEEAPPEADPSRSRASPPQSSLRDDSSPIEGEPVESEPMARSAP